MAARKLSNSLEAVLLGTPDAPTALRQDTNISLGWQENALVSSYKIYRGNTDSLDDASLIAASSNATGYIDQAVLLDTDYYYFISSCNANGCSPNSSGTYAALLSVPASPQASRQNTNLSLSWTDNSRASSYRVLRNTSNNLATASLLTDSITSNSFVDNGVSTDTSYFYFVEACNENGCSDA